MERTPAKGAAQGTREIILTLPVRPEQATSLSLRANTRRVRAAITLTEGRAEHFPKISSMNPNEPSPARLPFSSFSSEVNHDR